MRFRFLFNDDDEDDDSMFAAKPPKKIVVPATLDEPEPEPVKTETPKVSSSYHSTRFSSECS